MKSILLSGLLLLCGVSVAGAFRDGPVHNEEDLASAMKTLRRKYAPFLQSLRLLDTDGRAVQETSHRLAVADTERGTVTFTTTCPEAAGKYELIAELRDGGRPVRSYRPIEAATAGSEE